MIKKFCNENPPMEHMQKKKKKKKKKENSKNVKEMSAVWFYPNDNWPARTTENKS